MSSKDKSGLVHIDVAYVARLARIALNEDEALRLKGQLAEILAYIDKLNKADTAVAEPTSHVMPIQNVSRDDAPRPPLSTGQVLANAPQKKDNFFKVPKVIE
jgi:aspartyl-tRNA(Asn)/glutamyl-tRNA(Gln) amidotransferase subunit C